MHQLQKRLLIAAVMLLTKNAFTLTSFQELCLKSSEGDFSQAILSTLPASKVYLLPNLNLLFNRSTISDKLQAFDLAKSYDPVFRFALLNRIRHQEVTNYLRAHLDEAMAAAKDPFNMGKLVDEITEELHFDIHSE